MPTNEQLRKLFLFMAVGYLCGGIVLTFLGGISFWSAFFEGDFFFTTILVIALCTLGAISSFALMRYAIPRIGAKRFFEQDVLVLIIGLFLLALAINKAIIAIGVFLSAGALTMYFYENFKFQVSAVKEGGLTTTFLSGWAIGPICAVILLSISSEIGMFGLRLIFAHYIAIGFWVWLRRMKELDFQDNVPRILSLDKKYQEKQKRQNGKSQANVNRTSQHQQGQKESFTYTTVKAQRTKKATIFDKFFGSKGSK